MLSMILISHEGIYEKKIALLKYTHVQEPLVYLNNKKKNIELNLKHYVNIIRNLYN